MKYTVFSIDDCRKRYTKPLINYLDGIGWKRVETQCVNGSNPDELEAAIEKHGLVNNMIKARVGHMGIWCTVLNALEHAPVVTFEDDALLGPNFQLNWDMRFRRMPKDTDFFSLFLPRDSNQLYNESMAVNRYITRTYQRYGGVSMYYTEKGVEKIKALLERDGITGQYDDTLYRYAKLGELKGYCSKPSLPDLVYITGQEPSIVQESSFMTDSLDLGPRLGDGYYDTLQAALIEAEEGHALEFGVATGLTLKMIASRMQVTGFDSFEGLPEDWRDGFPRGMFAQSAPDIAGAELVVGWFDDTLADWIQMHRGRMKSLSLVHIDCDLYSSTVTILNEIGDYLVPGVVVVFDEYHGYPGWEDHEYKAWNEFIERTGKQYDIIGHGPEQLAVKMK